MPSSLANLYALRMLPQTLSEARTETVRRSGKAPVWRARARGGEEKEDGEGGEAASGSLRLPFARRAGAVMALSLAVWDEDVSRKAVDDFIGMCVAGACV